MHSRSSPGGHKALRRADFLPAGNPAHSLHPPPLMSQADAEFRKPRVLFAGGVAYKQYPSVDARLGNQMNGMLSAAGMNELPVPSFSVPWLSELKQSRQVRPVVAPGLWMAAVAHGQKTHFPHLTSWLQVPPHLPMKTRAQRDAAAWKSPLGRDGTSAPN